MIGSRTRDGGVVGCSDENSDWDFHVITSDPMLLATSAWSNAARLPAPIAYVVRQGRLGRVSKVSAVFPEGGLDLVLIPFQQFRFIKALYLFRLIGCFPRVEEALSELALVLSFGYRILKASQSWRSF